MEYNSYVNTGYLCGSSGPSLQGCRHWVSNYVEQGQIQKKGLLIKLKRGRVREGYPSRRSKAEPQPPTLFHYVMRKTLHNAMILPYRLFARRAACTVVIRISAIFTLQ